MAKGFGPGLSKGATGDITSVVAGDGLSGGATDGAATVTLDLNELTAAAVADGDSIAIIDANDSNASRKEAVHDLATLFSGTGLTATSSVIAVDAAQTQITSIGTQGANVVLGDAANLNISVPLLATTDHTSSGMTAQMLAGATIAAQNLVCIHTTTQEVVVADASAYATARVIGINPSNSVISDTATGTILLHGFVRDDTWTWTTGKTLYLSETAGALTETAPTTSGAFVVAVGVALSPDVVYINPSMDVIEHA
jgi:hypothetical protein